MTDREKLIELLKAADRYEFEETRNSGVYDREAAWEYIADHLLANGVRLEPKQATSDENKRWVPVTERLPDDDIPSSAYLCWWSGHCQICKYWRSRKAFEFNGRVVHVTHWMPLPSTEGLK